MHNFCLPNELYLNRPMFHRLFSLLLNYIIAPLNHYTGTPLTQWYLGRGRGLAVVSASMATSKPQGEHESIYTAACATVVRQGCENVFLFCVKQETFKHVGSLGDILTFFDTLELWIVCKQISSTEKRRSPLANKARVGAATPDILNVFCPLPAALTAAASHSLICSICCRLSH